MRYEGVGDGRAVEEEVACEAPLTLYVDGEELVTLLCTPTDLEELVVGYLASEGVLASPADIRWLAVDPERGEAFVATRDGRGRGLSARFTQRTIGACCGKGRLSLYWQNDVATVRSLAGRGPVLETRTVLDVMAGLRRDAAGDVFGRTGGVHDACLAGGDGAILARRADIGRHNALDKLYGMAVLTGLDRDDLIAVVSGRVSSEVLLKVAKMGIAVLVSKAACTDLALRLAEELGMTVAGFVRDGRMTVYAGEGRIRR